MLQERHEELDGRRRGDRGEPRTGDGTHLVERPVSQGLRRPHSVNTTTCCQKKRTYVGRSDDVIAIITSQALFVRSWSRRRGTRTMAHHKVRIEPQRRVQHNLTPRRVNRTYKEHQADAPCPWQPPTRSATTDSRANP